VLPDACVDVVLTAGRLVVAGPATSAVEVAATPDQHRCGVRFRVGWAGAALGVPADELRDLDVPLEEVWGADGRRLSSAVSGAPDAETALDLLIRGVAALRGAHDPYARQAALLLPGHHFAVISRDLGVSERQLRRQVQRAVGYGPRTLTRVLRLQRFLRAAQTRPGASLARLAADTGYADQAHLARECRDLTGQTPSALRAAGAGAAGEPVSDAFKPAGAGPASVGR